MRTQFNAALLLTLSAFAAAPALAETGTIQPAGPRTGNNGIAFFNIEGSATARTPLMASPGSMFPASRPLSTRSLARATIR